MLRKLELFIPMKEMSESIVEFQRLFDFQSIDLHLDVGGRGRALLLHFDVR